MLRKKVPHRLWYYGLKWVVEIIQRTDGSAVSLHYWTSLEEVTGENPDISEYFEFAFYDWCWYSDNESLGETKLGKWLVVSHRFGSIMFYWVLTANVTVVSRTTISRVTNLEDQTDENKSRITVLDKAIQVRLNDKGHVIVEGGKGKPNELEWTPFWQRPMLSGGIQSCRLQWQGHRGWQWLLARFLWCHLPQHGVITP